jgi:hypothetical protein
LQTIEAKATEILATVAAEVTQVPDQVKGLTREALKKIVPTGSSVGTLRGCIDVDGAKCTNFNFLSVLLWLITASLIGSSSLCASTYFTNHWEASQRSKVAIRIARKARQWGSTFLSVGGLFSSLLMCLLIKKILDVANDLNQKLPGTLERGFAHTASLAIIVCATLHLIVTTLFYDTQHRRYNSANTVTTNFQ